MFNDLLDEAKGFKYQITLTVVSKKYNINLTTKTVINHKLGLYKSFQEILYRIDNWINEGSGEIAELIKSH